MITYKGDFLVRGKTFIKEGVEYKFIKKTAKGDLFSVNNDLKVLAESEVKELISWEK